MTKKPIDYSNSIIYSICDLNNHECLYIGSTTNFIKRKYNHKKDCLNENCRYYNLPIYIKIREIGLNNIDFKPIEILSLNNKIELLSRERYWIEYYKPKYNSRTPIIFENEITKKNTEKNNKWRASNRDIYNNGMKEWRAKNKDRYNKYSRDLRKWISIKKEFLNILL
jgi:GIY-YIG catalytic domain